MRIESQGNDGRSGHEGWAHFAYGIAKIGRPPVSIPILKHIVAPFPANSRVFFAVGSVDILGCRYHAIIVKLGSFSKLSLLSISLLFPPDRSNQVVETVPLGYVYAFNVSIFWINFLF